MSFSIDVNETNFNPEVVEASHKTPVLIDFWATWCEPCKSLLPTLGRLADEYAGQFRLAKIEVEQEQNLAAQFAIRSVPTVKIMINGEVVDEFSGVLPEQQIREFINKHLNPTDNSPLQQAITAYQQGETESALMQMQAILLADSENPVVRIEFSNMLMREKRFDDARDVLDSLNAEDKNNPAALALFGQLESIKAVMAAPDIDDLLQTVEKDPGNCLAREQLSAHYKLRGDYVAAMEQLLQIVRQDRRYNEDAGRTELLKIFDMLSHEHELVGQYRKKLAQALN
ncbi:MAG: tetratricopeptide repeat protein [Gammaproteobacteria bacterium]|nr:tetratricopeptide repeat protein [Gammaproteobacteria bacterium]